MRLDGKVLVTGGSGFLGRAILRRAVREEWPCDITVLSRDELKQSLCRHRYPWARYVLGDVRDRDLLSALLTGYDTVIHTAAMKYVPEGEFNASECINVNVGGTATLLSCARVADVERVVVVSTDKAVEPVNVYGATKMLCERMVGETAQYDGLWVTCVRYGNVVGSTGSVIPELIRQSQSDEGMVTITDPRMTRFWIGVDTAIDLVLVAANKYVERGSVVVPTPKAMTMMAVAETITPSGHIEVVGPRPGEKKHELLLTFAESRYTVDNHDGYLELPAVSRRGEPRTGEYQLSSEFADRMSREELHELIADSQDV